MKKLLMIALVAAVVLPMVALMTGCETMVMDTMDRQHMIRRNIDIERKQFNEDVDYLMLWDEPSQLSPWYLPDPE